MSMKETESDAKGTDTDTDGRVKVTSTILAVIDWSL